jgi:hypothetical protein
MNNISPIIYSHFDIFAQSNTWQASLENIKNSSCGNKHDILVKMHRHFTQHPLDGVEVPLPRGISSIEVELFLKEKAPLFFTYWSELQKLYDQNELSYEQFFEKPEVIQLLFKAQDEIKKAMTHFLLPLEIENWIENSLYYMVRSSGAEDGKKTANAGGNLSCKYVPKKEISARIGDVIASYLDKRSLINRIKSDENPFSESLSLSVTIQDLIGEVIGGEKDPNNIPIAVVLFTNEPTYVGKEPFRIMKLSASYGHGEGVVGNQGILTDTVFVLQSQVDRSDLYVWYDNQEKQERLAPVKAENGIVLESIANPEGLINQPALSHPMIKRLFQLGLKIEELFEEPTDMELVIKNKKIYIVQARPINRTPSIPTYLDLDTSELQRSMKAKVLVPGGNDALVINSAKEILVEDTLEKACDGLRNSHRLVITREDEPLNSHPVICMSEHQIPCLYHKEGLDTLISEFQQKKAGENTVLIACVQQSIVALAKDSFKTAIKKGYISHPAPLNCAPDKIMGRKKKSTTPLELQGLLKRIRIEQTKGVALQLFEKLSKESLLTTIVERVQYAPLAPLAKELQQRITTTLQELGAALFSARKDERLQILFYAKALETLIWGDGYSVIHLKDLSEEMSCYEQKVHIARLQGKEHVTANLNRKKVIFAEESLIASLIPETSDAWIDFLVKVESEHGSEEIKSLQKLLNSIGNARSLWLTFFFDPARKKAANSTDLLHTLLKEFDPPSQEFVDQLRKLEMTIDRFKTEAFSDPAARQYALIQLLKIIKEFENSKFTETFSKSCPLAKIIAAQILAKAVALYDKSIKIVKTCPHYPLDVKATLFQEMLGHYLSLLKIVALELVGEGKFPNQGVTLNAYITTLEEIQKKSLDQMPLQAIAELLAPSTGFSVLASMFGSGALFSRHLPVSLEDVFTLIHQNLNACTSLLFVQNIHFHDITPPPLFHETLQQIRQFLTTQMLGIEQDSEQLLIRFNAPLRSHSSTFQLVFRENKVFLSVQLLGQARERWTQTHQYLYVLDALKIQPLASRVIQRGDVLNFSWCLENAEQFAHTLNVLRVIYNFSLDQNVAILHRNILDRILQHFPSLEAQNESYEKLASLAAQFVLNSEDSIKVNWVEVLSFLFDQGRIDQKISKNKELLTNFKDLINNQNHSHRKTILPLLARLTDRGIFLKEAALVAEQYVHDSDVAAQNNAMLILKSFTKQDPSGEESIAIFSRILFTNQSSTHSDSIIYVLLLDLIEKEKAWEMIAKFSEKWIALDDEFVFYGFKCLEELVGKGFNREKVLTIIEPYLTNSDSLKGQFATRLEKILNGSEDNSNSEPYSLWST